MTKKFSTKEDIVISTQTSKLLKITKSTHRRLRKSIMKISHWFRSRFYKSSIWCIKNFDSYEDYLSLQVTKTLDPERRERWLTDEWEPKVTIFRDYFKQELDKSIFSDAENYPLKKALCIGARTGQEVQALIDLGVDAIGVDIVPNEPLVQEGDLHDLPFQDATFNLVFSNVFDHALYPDRMVAEMERVCDDSGLMLLHLQIGMSTDFYGVTEIRDIEAVSNLFKSSNILKAEDITELLTMTHQIVAQKSSR